LYARDVLAISLVTLAKKAGVSLICYRCTNTTLFKYRRAKLSVHGRCINKGDTSTHAQGPFPKVTSGAYGELPSFAPSIFEQCTYIGCALWEVIDMCTAVNYYKPSVNWTLHTRTVRIHGTSSQSPL